MIPELGIIAYYYMPWLNKLKLSSLFRFKTLFSIPKGNIKFGFKRLWDPNWGVLPESGTVFYIFYKFGKSGLKIFERAGSLVFLTKEQFYSSFW